MASNGLSPRGKGTCHLLKGSEKNVSIGGITPGMTWNQVLAKFGQPTYVADDDWYFWSTSKTIEEFSNSREQMNWTGVQLEKGKVSRLFSSLLDHPCPVRDGREYALLPRAGGKEKINLLKLQLLKR